MLTAVNSPRFYKKSSDHCRYAHQQRIPHRKFPAEAAKKTCTDRKTKSGKTWKHRNSLAYSHPHGISEIRFPRALITVYIAVIHNQQDHAGKKDPDPGKTYEKMHCVLPDVYTDIRSEWWGIVDTKISAVSFQYVPLTIFA